MQHLYYWPFNRGEYCIYLNDELTKRNYRCWSLIDPDLFKTSTQTRHPLDVKLRENEVCIFSAPIITLSSLQEHLPELFI